MVKGDYTVDQVISKAQTLIEALPYIKKFQGKTIVVKYGGSAMLDENLKYNVIEDVALLKLVGLKPVIVHGGGKEISKWVEKVGKEPEFINGLRVTDSETMEIAEMVLSKVNKSLVSMMQKVGLKAVGISGKDGGLFTVKKRLPGGKDIGYVGEITKVDTEVIDALVDQDFIPVIAPIGVSEEYEDYNINADDAACAVATALKAEKLGATYLTAGHIYATDCKKGVPPRGLDFLRNVCEKVNIPVYAIGGIHVGTGQMEEVMKCGAKGGCIMSEMMKR